MTDEATLDPSHWDEALRQFALASGLTVSMLDLVGVRVVGPHAGGPVGAMLLDTPHWSPDGAGTRFEQELARATGELQTPQSAEFEGLLRVRTCPVFLGGVMVGTVVHGWVFGSFASSLACAALGKVTGASGSGLWPRVRDEAPVSDARMRAFSGLLEALVYSTSRHIHVADRLRSVARVRDVFLAQVSHDLRTPLSSIQLRLQLLLGKGGLDDPARTQKVLLAMFTNVQEEARLIDDLIEASRTLTGELPSVLEPISLREVILGASESILPLAADKGVELVLDEIVASSGTQINADAGRLQQVFWNLLSNAVKFTPPGGSIRVLLEEGAEAVRVDVVDTGCGLRPGVADRIFDTFVKEKVENPTGLGLGLSIARQIARGHGGDITVMSEGPGQGTRFTVSLPRL